MKANLDKVHLDKMHKDPNSWRGIFYVNRKDSRVWVPKLVPMTGWTLNFGNPYTYISIMAIAIILTVANYLL